MSGSDARVVLRRDSLVEFLRDRDAARPDEPADPEGLVLVSGGIVRRTLTERLAGEGIPTDLVRITTIEDLARDLVTESSAHPERSPAEVLERPLRKRALETVLGRADDEATALGAFARRVPWESGDVADQVLAELNEYHRSTDAAADHDALLGVIDDVAPERPFAAEETRENVRAFRELDAELRECAGDRFVSRSHLVRAARDAFDAWDAATGDPDWVALATVSAVDNPTLRLLASIADRAPLHLFAGAGTASTLETRLRSPDVPVAVEWGPRDGAVETDAAGKLLAAATDHEAVTVGDGDGIRAASVPDRRREVEVALRDARKRRRDGATTLLVAREAGEYERPVHDVGLTADLPTRVETRRDVDALPAFQAVEATVRLLASAADRDSQVDDEDDGDDDVAPHEILAPLRAGFCLPAGDSSDDGSATAGDWPLSATAVQDVAAALRSRSPRPLDAWRSDLPGDGPFAAVQAFLAWVDERRDSPPGDGQGLEALVDEVLAAHADRVGERAPRDRSGIAVDPDRATATEKHPLFHAGQVRTAAPAAGDAYDWLQTVLDRPAAWATAATAVTTGLGTESYGLPDDDAGAVPVVDAGNAYYRRADRVYVLGLGAERFPRSPHRFAFLHRAVRAALYRGTARWPYLYLNGEAVQYERDLDAYEAALRAADRGITLVWPYKDDEGRDRPRSPFLDAVDVDEAAHARIDLGEWVAFEGKPTAESGESGEIEEPTDPGTNDGNGDGDEPAKRDAIDGSGDDLDHLAPKERLRTLARFADRPTGRGPPAEELDALAESVDPGDAERILEAVDRFESLATDDEGNDRDDEDDEDGGDDGE